MLNLEEYISFISRWCYKPRAGYHLCKDTLGWVSDVYIKSDTRGRVHNKYHLWVLSPASAPSFRQVLFRYIYQVLVYEQFVLSSTLIAASQFSHMVAAILGQLSVRCLLLSYYIGIMLKELSQYVIRLSSVILAA